MHTIHTHREHACTISSSRVGPGSCGGRGSRGGRTHSAKARGRGRGRGRGLETLEISETTTEEEEGGEWLKLGAIKLVTDFDLNQH